MNCEHKSQPISHKPYEAYGFTERERLSWRISQERFNGILQDEQTLIHEIKDAANSYGEFIFVTTSRPSEQGRVGMTFYGLGYHDYRERWFTKEWYWYQTRINPNTLELRISQGEASELLQNRLESIKPFLEETQPQTNRGAIFELLAELTDEDGALAELQDLGCDWEWTTGGINV